MSPGTERRLQPAHIVVSGDLVWLVDASRPAAAVVASDGIRLVSWSAPDPDVVPALTSRAVVPHPDGIVVQDGSAITWVGPDHSRSQPAAEGSLRAADRDYAWLVDGQTPNYQGPDGQWAFPLPHDDSGELIALAPDGARRSFRTDRPVHDVTLDGADMVIRFAAPPLFHAASFGGWSMEYPQSELRIARELVLRDGVVVEPVRLPARPPDHQRADGIGDVRWAWLERDPAVVVARGERAGGLAWWAGADPGGDRIDRRVHVRAYDVETDRLNVALDAGSGLVVTARAVGAEFWIAIARQRFLAVPGSAGTEVVAVAADGAFRTVLAPDALDISFTDPPLAARPSDGELAEAVASVRRPFLQLADFWRDDRGDTHPLAAGLTDPSVAVEGEWPDTTVVVTLRHPSRPGLLLRRRFSVFDERGRPCDHENAEIDLMEDLDTGYLAPADEAVDGVLDT